MEVRSLASDFNALKISASVVLSRALVASSHNLREDRTKTRASNYNIGTPEIFRACLGKHKLLFINKSDPSHKLFTKVLQNTCINPYANKMGHVDKSGRFKQTLVERYKTINYMIPFQGKFSEK